MRKQVRVKPVTVISEHARFEGVRTRHAFAWVPSQDQTFNAAPLGARTERVRAEILDAVARSNWSQDEKRACRRTVRAMDESALRAFAARLRAAR